MTETTSAHVESGSRMRRWWYARHTRTDLVTLTQGNVYILPTGAGWMLAATLSALLVASINFQLNLGYLLTFMLAGCAIVGMGVGHHTLRGLTLHLLPPPPIFAGDSAILDIRLINTRLKARHAIGISLAGSNQWSWTDIEAQAESFVKLSFKPARRGEHYVPALTAETRFPLGTFRVWTLWRPAAHVLVYPSPEPNAPTLPEGEPHPGSGMALTTASSGEFDGVRNYRRGDLMKRIVWKKFAKSNDLVSRDSTQAQRFELWLDFAATGTLDKESRLARLTAWVLAADARGLDYGLRGPGIDIKPAGGVSQKLRCLRALALC